MNSVKKGEKRDFFPLIYKKTHFFTAIMVKNSFNDQNDYIYVYKHEKK